MGRSTSIDPSKLLDGTLPFKVIWNTGLMIRNSCKLDLIFLDYTSTFSLPPEHPCGLSRASSAQSGVFHHTVTEQTMVTSWLISGECCWTWLSCSSQLVLTVLLTRKPDRKHAVFKQSTESALAMGIMSCLPK